MNNNYNLTTGNIEKTLIKLSIPLVLTSFIQIAYGFVDMLFIGRLGTDSVAGVGIAGFMFWIATAIALIPKVGMGVYASQAYGACNKKETIRVLSNGFILTIILGIIYTIFIRIIKDIFVDMYDLGAIAEKSAKEYMLAASFGLIFFVLNPVFSQSFTALGDSMTPFKINALGAITNIILDPIFIFGFGPISPMGVKGAAIATIIGQIVVSLAFLISIFKNNKIIKKAITKIDYRINWQVEIFKLGLPAALLSGFHAFISIILNRYMAIFGDTAVAAYAIGTQLESITRNTTEGVEVGIQALVGQNYGAGNNKRVRDAIKVSLKLVFMIGLFGAIILFTFRKGLIGIFVPNDLETINLGAKYLAILSISQIFMGLEIGATGIFNGLTDSRTPATVGVLFNLSRIPLSRLLMPIFGVVGVWISVTITSILKGTVNLILLRRKVKKFFN